MVYFVENYTFSPQREIQSEYYHSDQVSIFVHVLYRHAQESIYGMDNTPQSRDVIKEYHFYVSDDREHDTLFVQHFFGLIYDSFKKNGVSFKGTLDLVRWVWKEVQIKMLILLVELPSQRDMNSTHLRIF